MIRSVAAALLVTLVVGSGRLRADDFAVEEAGSPSADAAPGDRVVEEEEDLWHGASRPWLYAADPTGPDPYHLVAALGIAYAQIDRGAARPFAADLAHAGAVFDVALELGVASWASLQAQGLLAGESESRPLSAGTMVGASIFPMPDGLPVDLATSAGYLRELGGGNGVWGRVGVAGDIRLVRLGFTALGEHVFEPGRDGVDIMLTSGASLALGPARLGVEYVVQDLEGAWEPEEADGGIRHFVGPTAAVELAGRVQIVAGPAFGLAQGSPDVLGRLAATSAF